MKPCLIFDLDGTLVDSLPGIAASLNRALTAHGLPGHSHEAVRSFIGNGVRTLVGRSVQAGAGQDLVESLLRFFKADYELSWPEGTSAYPGIYNMLEILAHREFRLSVLSNKTHEFTVSMVRAIFPDTPFTTVLGQRDGIPHKPDPAGAIQIAAAFNTTPEDCVVIGDSTMDIETAANAGMRVIAVGWGYHDLTCLLASGAGQVIAQPEELPDLLCSLY